MPPKYLLRVYIATDVAVKVTLNERPTSVDELIGTLKDKVKPRLDFEFLLQYEDPDFGGELCCLVEVEDLPEKSTLRVVRSEGDQSSCGSSDTDILPHVPVSQRQKTLMMFSLSQLFRMKLNMSCKRGTMFLTKQSTKTQHSREHGLLNVLF